MTTLHIVIFILVLCFLGVLWEKLKPRKSLSESPTKDIKMHYVLQNSIMSAAELTFYHALSTCITDDQIIFTKVRIADVLDIQEQKTKENFGKWKGAFMKISQKHFDYLICDKSNMSVICAVELNDKSHQEKKRNDRDLFVEQACKEANLPLLMYPCYPTYKLDVLSDTLAITINSK